MDKLKKTLKQIKQLNWNNSLITFYVAHRTLISREAHYKVFLVNADESLRKKLRKSVAAKIEASNTAREYDYETIDIDDDVLGLEAGETDFQAIIDILHGNKPIDQVTNSKQLLQSWIYIVQLNLKDEQPLYAVRKVSTSWATKSVKQLINMVFKNNMLVDINNEEVFRVDGKIDFYAFDGKLFIADKKSFEAAMNFRIGMENNRDAIIEEFRKLKIIADVDILREIIGNNMPRLRKISQVKKAGYYADKNYIIRLKMVSETEGWGLEFDEKGHIIIAESNVDTVLRILNNDRLSSKINEENFDVDVKHKI
jgi:hypothetical protein